MANSKPEHVRYTSWMRQCFAWIHERVSGKSWMRQAFSRFHKSMPRWGALVLFLVGLVVTVVGLTDLPPVTNTALGIMGLTIACFTFLFELFGWAADEFASEVAIRASKSV